MQMGMVADGRILHACEQGVAQTTFTEYSPSTCDVQRKLADRDGHAVDTEITKTEDTRA